MRTCLEREQTSARWRDGMMHELCMLARNQVRREIADRCCRALWVLTMLMLNGCAGWTANPPMAAPVLSTTSSATVAAADRAHAAPTRGQPCPAWVHDAYTVVGPDGKRYPTWHPPVDQRYGCSFDHEHGDDPRTSVLFQEVGMPPFGYVNAIEGQRKEDHVGNKVFVINDDTRGGSLLVKLHQGTHSPDAFSNNLHELQYHYRNADGRRLDIMILAAFGRSGELAMACGANDRQVVQTSAATNDFGSASSGRIIPSAACYDNVHPAYENWLSDNHITTADGRELVAFNPHFAVFHPSRYFAPELPQKLGRSVDRCRALAAPVHIECRFVRDNPAIAWDDPRSPFRGDQRELFVNQNVIVNAKGPQVWYCDPYGRNARATPFPGSVEQHIASMEFTIPEPPLIFGAENSHDGPAVHSPN